MFPIFPPLPFPHGQFAPLLFPLPYRRRMWCIFFPAARARPAFPRTIPTLHSLVPGSRLLWSCTGFTFPTGSHSVVGHRCSLFTARNSRTTECFSLSSGSPGLQLLEAPILLRLTAYPPSLCDLPSLSIKPFYPCVPPLWPRPPWPVRQVGRTSGRHCLVPSPLRSPHPALAVRRFSPFPANFSGHPCRPRGPNPTFSPGHVGFARYPIFLSRVRRQWGIPRHRNFITSPPESANDSLHNHGQYFFLWLLKAFGANGT